MDQLAKIYDVFESLAPGPRIIARRIIFVGIFEDMEELEAAILWFKESTDDMESLLAHITPIIRDAIEKPDESARRTVSDIYQTIHAPIDALRQSNRAVSARKAIVVSKVHLLGVLGRPGDQVPSVDADGMQLRNPTFTSANMCETSEVLKRWQVCSHEHNYFVGRASVCHNRIRSLFDGFEVAFNRDIN